MSDSTMIGIKKKHYTKPLVTEVRLVAQEAVLATCKDVGAYTACRLISDLTCANPDGSGWTAHS